MITQRTTSTPTTIPHTAPAGLGSAVRGLAAEPLNWLLPAFPIALGAHYAGGGDVWTFVLSGLAIVPLAGLLGRATENLAETAGAAVGGLLNATFGNAAELIIGLMLLARGPTTFSLVKASITGAIIGNVLLVLGLAILAGGFVHRRQFFNRTYAVMGSTLLALASIGLIVPTLTLYRFQATGLPAKGHQTVQALSGQIAAILILIYGASLVFALRTHRHVSGVPDEDLPTTGDERQPEWSPTTSVVLLAAATAGVAWMSDLLAGSVESAGRSAGLNPVFMGAVVVAIVGNAAEHSTAVLMAVRNKMDLAFHIAVGSATQIALLVAPVLVFASLLMGHSPSLTLHFSLLETVTVLMSVGVLALVSQDGETNWMEGLMLVGVYIILGLAFYHLPEMPGL